MMLWNVRILVLCSFLFSAYFAFSRDSSPQNKSVHLAPEFKSSELSQGEEMLLRKPEFKSYPKVSSADPIGKANYQLVGTCKSGRGIASSNLNSKAYSECIVPESGISGSSPSDLNGVSGRQAGVGLLLGK